MADDDLGAFFSEIEQVEKTVETTKTEEVAVAAPVQVVAKPEVIVRAPEIVEKPRPTVTTTYNSSTAQPQESWSEMSAFESSSSYPSHEITMPPSEPVQPVSQPFIPVQQNKKYVRCGAGQTWVDPTLNEWPENDYRLFVGDLGNEVTTDMLAREFQKYKSFAKAKVIRGGWNSKSRGYGFVSFLDPFDCAKALREMNGKYIGNRPMKIRKSTWKDHDIKEVKKKEHKKRKLQESLGLTS